MPASKEGEIRHFMFVSGAWEESDAPHIPLNDKIRAVATVLRFGKKRLVLTRPVLPNEKRTAESNWLDPDNYPKSFLRRTLEQDAPFEISVRQFLRPTEDSTKRHIDVKYTANVSRTSKNLRFIRDTNEPQTGPGTEGAVDQLRGNGTFFTAFKSSRFTDEQDRPLTFFMRVEVKVRGNLLNTWNAMVGSQVGSLLRLIAVEHVEAGDEPSEESDSAPAATDKASKTPPAAELDRSGAESPESNPVFNETGFSLALLWAVFRETERGHQLIKWFEGTRATVVERWRKLLADKPEWVAMAALLLVSALVALLVRDHTVVINRASTAPVNKADLTGQYLLFAAALLLPMVVTPLGRYLRKRLGAPHVDTVTVQPHTGSGYLRQTLLLRRTIESIVFALGVYLVFSLLAWTDVSSSTHIWIWSDRQTIGLVVTMLVGVLSALFSNSLRDLSTVNTEIIVSHAEAMSKLRHVMNEVNELADRFWSEYDAMFKDVGKVFLFRANEFAHYVGKDGSAPIEQVVERLGGLIGDTTGGTPQEEEGKKTTKMTEAIVAQLEDDERFKGLEWDEGGVVGTGPTADPIPWTFHFLPKDVPGLTAGGVRTPEDLLTEAKNLWDGLPAGATSAATVKTALRRVTETFLDDDDGRFCVVADITDEQKQYLTAIRTINAMVASVPLPAPATPSAPAASATDQTAAAVPLQKMVWGYFPTDERLTLWFINEMEKSGEWYSGRDGEFAAWLDEIYQDLTEFGRRNRERLGRALELVREAEKLMSGETIPSGLVLDDIHLLRELLQVGSDWVPDAEESAKKGTPDRTRAKLTLARALTYAAAHYTFLVWERDQRRALLPTFPSPYPPRPERSSVSTRHASERFESLRREMWQQFLTIGAEQWPDVLRKVTLEVSNRQGPLLNWLRAARAYASRQHFLSGSNYQFREATWISLVPTRQELMVRSVFPPQEGAPDSASNDRRAHRLLNPIASETGVGRIVGPKSLKIARKSSYGSVSSETEHGDA